MTVSTAMNLPSHSWIDPAFLTLGWSAATIALYGLARLIHRRRPGWWSSPLVVTPILVIALVTILHTSYQEYIGGTGWLVTLLGPTTVAFAVPVYEQRALIIRHWPVLASGVMVGSFSSMVSAWLLASWLGLDDALRLSLLPRSMSTPFAMVVSRDIGGVPDLTAVFVVVSGVFGAAFGEVLHARLSGLTALARGTFLGMGAHGAGVAKAHQIGPEEGSVASLVMVLVGVVNVLAAPLLSRLLR